MQLRFNGAEVGNITVEEYQATRLAEAGVTDGSTLDLMIEPVDRDPERTPNQSRTPSQSRTASRTPSQSRSQSRRSGRLPPWRKIRG